MKLSIIGSVGIPNLYGGFESFVESCSPYFLRTFKSVFVTCCSKSHDDHSFFYNGIQRIFIRIPANGFYSIIHDLVAFISIFYKSSHILVLGVSGGIWFPLFYFCCTVTGKKLMVNIDGVEWKRKKYSIYKKFFVKLFDYLCQRYSHFVVYDNIGLQNYLYQFAKDKSFAISYPGDHVCRLETKIVPKTALTICRIEPENNIELLINGALRSSLVSYTIVGNWKHSKYGKNLFAKYSHNPKLILLDPVYNPVEIAKLRGACSLYLHGHSVGGTNPSLVEMLFYDCTILCYDVSFNRYTASSSAGYFTTMESLSHLINKSIIKHCTIDSERINSRNLFTAHKISQSYVEVLTSSKTT